MPAAAGPDRADELALVERCRAGDLTAFETIYQAHAGRLYSVACRVLGNPTEAEDLLQEIFLSAHRKIRLYKGESALGTWLFRLATNLCLDHLRSRANRTAQATESIDADTGHQPAGAKGPILGVIDRIDLERALAELPAGCREVFVLYDVEGFEHREVGSLLGISEGTSKSQLHKARMRLREALASVNHTESVTEESGDLASGPGDHLADAATDTYLRELDEGLEENAEHLLTEIEGALQRIADGTYGTCVVCGREIDAQRLEAVPYATLCIDDKRAQERG